MYKKSWSINNTDIRFDRIYVIQTIKSFLSTGSWAVTEDEKCLLVERVINKVEIFEKKLSDRFKRYLDHDHVVDHDHINDVMRLSQIQIRYYISVCMQQEFKHLTL